MFWAGGISVGCAVVARRDVHGDVGVDLLLRALVTVSVPDTCIWCLRVVLLVPVGDCGDHDFGMMDNFG